MMEDEEWVDDLLSTMQEMELKQQQEEKQRIQMAKMQNKPRTPDPTSYARPKEWCAQSSAQGRSAVFASSTQRTEMGEMLEKLRRERLPSPAQYNVVSPTRTLTPHSPSSSPTAHQHNFKGRRLRSSPLKDTFAGTTCVKGTTSVVCLEKKHHHR
eukprot:m.132996 g.132996  ORF g.132996 m.132996 type:complete len:155 (-) comp13096_c1_seq5:260-724(-)